MPAGGSELPFECPTCKKSLSSGKGLGGHKKAHLRDAASSDLRMVQHSQGSGTAATENQIVAQSLNSANPCPICGKGWPSLKSLHGHMRKHRDRNWRGMKPPTPEAAPLLLEGGAASGCADRRLRRHGKAPMEMIPEAGTLSPNREEGSRPKIKKQKVEPGNSRSVFGFDLNELPPPEERGDGGWIIGEEGYVAGCL